MKITETSKVNSKQKFIPGLEVRLKSKYKIPNVSVGNVFHLSKGPKRPFLLLQYQKCNKMKKAKKMIGMADFGDEDTIIKSKNVYFYLSVALLLYKI